MGCTIVETEAFVLVGSEWLSYASSRAKYDKFTDTMKSFRIIFDGKTFIHMYSTCSRIVPSSEACLLYFEPCTPEIECTLSDCT